MNVDIETLFSVKLNNLRFLECTAIGKVKLANYQQDNRRILEFPFDGDPLL